MCCSEGDKILTRIADPPRPLFRLLTSAEPNILQFRRNIRQYNTAFAFTASIDVKLDGRLKGDCLLPFQIHGEIYNEIGTLEFEPGKPLALVDTRFFKTGAKL